MEHFLEDGNMLKCKERRQCLVEIVAWVNDIVCSSMRYLTRRRNLLISGACFLAWILEQEKKTLM
jgi:hypothetical protein